MKIQMFHNPRCSKSRGVLKILQAEGVTFDVIEYLKTPLNLDELQSILRKLNLKPFELVRTGENIFTEMKLDRLDPADDSVWLDVLVKYPKLLQRPIVVWNDKAVVARPPEKVFILIRST